MIGSFVRASHSKSDLINCAGAGKRTLWNCGVLSCSLFMKGKIWQLMKPLRRSMMKSWMTACMINGQILACGTCHKTPRQF
ncbi:hypothetical protein D2E16_02230 [Streptococcus suis]|nr:hypothetical protein D2E16_02230 [Streptococcus suis]